MVPAVRRWPLLPAGGRHAVATSPRNVLVLYANGRLVPGNIAVEDGLQSSLVSTVEQPVHYNSEFLDNPEFGGEAYERVITMYLHDKYVANPPEVVIAVGRDALEFLLRQRAQLFPHAPIVHAAVIATLPATDGRAAAGCGRRADRLRHRRHCRAGPALASGNHATGRRDGQHVARSRMGNHAPRQDDALSGPREDRVPVGVAHHPDRPAPA